MHLGLTAEQLAEAKKFSSVTGVVKKKKAKGSISNVFGQSVEHWSCFRGAGRFFVNYPGTKKPVALA